MLWNWNTVGSCFIASSWRITSPAVFAGSCIGVILLTMSLELLRRAVKEYDAYLIRTYAAHVVASVVADDDSSKNGDALKNGNGAAAPVVATGYRPTILQQSIRAFIHMVQFAVAYFLMLCVFSAPLLYP
jgi:copper transporter 1